MDLLKAKVEYENFFENYRRYGFTSFLHQLADDYLPAQSIEQPLRQLGQRV